MAGTSVEYVTDINTMEATKFRPKREVKHVDLSNFFGFCSLGLKMSSHEFFVLKYKNYWW